jgi:predicted nucleic acid-binding protein
LALYYLDTSALVKLYIREPGTDWMLSLTSIVLDNRFAILALTQVEFRSALRKRQRAGDIDPTDAINLIARFTRHLKTRFHLEAVNNSLLDTASGLIDRYPLRAYDATQLAGCLSLRARSRDDEPIFVCSDRQLLQAGTSEGLRSLDPTVPPPAA